VKEAIGEVNAPDRLPGFLVVNRSINFSIVLVILRDTVRRIWRDVTLGTLKLLLIMLLTRIAILDLLKTVMNLAASLNIFSRFSFENTIVEISKFGNGMKSFYAILTMLTSIFFPVSL
jgi:hypothetical protein